MANDIEWAAEIVKRVGAAAKRERGSRTAKWLSERTEELGHKISPTVIAKLDSGHRGDVLSVAELLIIAAALDVPPIALLYPDLPDGRVEVVPGRPLPTQAAMHWFNGTGFAALQAERSNLGKLSYLTRRRIAMKDRLPRLQSRVDEAQSRVRESLDAADRARAEQELELAETELQEAKEDIRHLNQRMGEIPGAVVDDA